jgi:hypothetical protein
MQNLWLSNPANSAFLAGTATKPKGKSSGGCGLIVFLGIFVAFGLVFVGIGVNEIRTQSRLEQSGETIAATIYNLDIDTSGDSTDYEISYRYRVGEQEYTRTEDVSRDFYFQQRVGGRLDIVYDPVSPSTSRIAAQIGRSPIWLFILFGVVFAIIPLFVIFGAAAQADRNEQLAKKGQIVYGEVTAFEGDTDSDGDFMAKLNYRIARPDGSIFEHRDRFRTNHNEWSDHPPKKGDRVAVLYLDDKKYMLL